ncbi:MAG: branched-chain amino acid ABC transporter substrate-binding protein [Betaproteobacteria bacterium]|nr:branched-chain amino acid ABC transporter substrate-binding protein [Betaproteobacteria bacterium]
MKTKATLCTAIVAATLATAGSVRAEPLKMALIDALSGPGAQTGLKYLEGVQFGVERLNREGGFNGAPIELMKYDSQTAPIVASEKLKEAIAAGARIVMQVSSSAVAAQLSDDIRKYNLRNPGKEVIFLNIGSEAYELTAAKCHFWFFRMGSNPYVRMNALIPVMKERGALGKSVYLINQNYSYGHDGQKAQEMFLKKAGISVAGTILHDVNKLQDFSPYIARVRASGAESVLSVNWGNDAILLLKAAGDAGLKAAFGTTEINTPGTIASAGKAVVGSYLASIFSLEGAGKAGEAFAEDYRARTGSYPTFIEPTPVHTLLMLGDVLKKISAPGAPVDTKKIALAFENASYETPMGRWSIRKEDHQSIMPIAVSIVSPDAKYKMDGTDLGFKPVRIVPGPEAAVPVDPACKMERPS